MAIPTSVPGRLQPASPPFTLSTEERKTGAAAAFFGAPLDASGSFRPGMGAGPGAVRRLSDSLETYSPALDADLEDLALVDLGDLDLDGASVAEAIDPIAATMPDPPSAARPPLMPR